MLMIGIDVGGTFTDVVYTDTDAGVVEIHTNQAGVWALLRHLGSFDRLTGLGRLLREHLVE